MGCVIFILSRKIEMGMLNSVRSKCTIFLKQIFEIHYQFVEKKEILLQLQWVDFIKK